MRPIAPRTGHREITIAEDQVEYKPITAAVAEMESGNGHALILRFTFTPEERQQLAAGADVYFCQVYPNGGPMTPVQARVGAGDWQMEPTA